MGGVDPDEVEGAVPEPSLRKNWSKRARIPRLMRVFFLLELRWEPASCTGGGSRISSISTWGRSSSAFSPCCLTNVSWWVVEVDKMLVARDARERKGIMSRARWQRRRRRLKRRRARRWRWWQESKESRKLYSNLPRHYGALERPKDGAPHAPPSFSGFSHCFAFPFPKHLRQLQMRVVMRTP